MVGALPQKFEKCYFLVSFLVLALRLEREKSGSFSHHLKSPFCITPAGKNAAKSLQADERYLCFWLIFEQR